DEVVLLVDDPAHDRQRTVLALRGILLEGDPCPHHLARVGLVVVLGGVLRDRRTAVVEGSTTDGTGICILLHSHSYLALINSRVTWTSIGLPLPSVSSPVNRPLPPSVAYESVPPITSVSPEKDEPGPLGPLAATPVMRNPTSPSGDSSVTKPSKVPLPLTKSLATCIWASKELSRNRVVA